MTGNKINSNPSFDTSEEESITPEETQENIETTPEENESGENTPSKENENDNSTEESPDGENKNLDNQEDEKKRALAGLVAEEEKLRTQDTDLDTEIAKVKERIKERRQSRRDKRDILEKVNQVTPEEEVDDLSDIDDATRTILERFVKAKGLVPKSELKAMQIEDTRKNAEKQFYVDHPEYLPENDPDDSLFSALKSELALFATPSDPALIAKLFERAHNNVRIQFPDRFTKANPATDAAKVFKKSVAQMGGGQASASSVKKSNSKPVDSAEKARKAQILLDGGWSEEDIKSLNL